MQISRTRILPAAKSLENIHYFSSSLMLLCCSRELLSLFAFIPGFAQFCSFINVETHLSYFLKCTYNSCTGNCANHLAIFTSLRKLPLLNTLLSYDRFSRAVTDLYSWGWLSRKIASSQWVRLFGLAEPCQVQIAMVLRNSLPQNILTTKIINEFLKWLDKTIDIWTIW